MGALLEKYVEMSSQKQQSAPREEKAAEVVPSSVPKHFLVSEDSNPADTSKCRGTKRNRRVAQAIKLQGEF